MKNAQAICTSTVVIAVIIGLAVIGPYSFQASFNDKSGEFAAYPPLAGTTCIGADGSKGLYMQDMVIAGCTNPISLRGATDSHLSNTTVQGIEK